MEVIWADEAQGSLEPRTHQLIDIPRTNASTAVYLAGGRQVEKEGFPRHSLRGAGVGPGSLMSLREEGT